LGRPKIIKEEKKKKVNEPKVHKPSVEQILLNICKNITDYAKQELQVVKMCGESVKTSKLDRDSGAFSKLEKELNDAKVMFHIKRNSALVSAMNDETKKKLIFEAISKGYLLDDDLRSKLSKVKSFNELRSIKFVALKDKSGD